MGTHIQKDASLIDQVKRAACNIIDQYPDRGVRVLAFDDRLVVFGEKGNTEIHTQHSQMSPLRRYALGRQPVQDIPESSLAVYTDDVIDGIDWPAAQSTEQKGDYKRRINELCPRGSTSFVSACMFVAKHVKDQSSVVALTDGFSNHGLGFERCVDIGTLFKEKCIQFSLIIPFTENNYCDLHSLMPLYTICEGDILYPKPQEIEKAFADSQTPIAFNALVSITCPGQSVQEIQTHKVTPNSIVYARIASSSQSGTDDVYCSTDTGIHCALTYTDLNNHTYTIDCQAQESDDGAIAREFITKTVSTKIRQNEIHVSQIGPYIKNMCTELGMSIEFAEESIQLFTVVTKLLLTPGLAMTPSQTDHMAGLVHTLSSNPSAGIPTNLQEALSQAITRIASVEASVDQNMSSESNKDVEE